MGSGESEIPRNYFELKGKTGEQWVHDLAQKTFLVDWCYLNPHRSNRKELCDLLVVYDDVALIWQVKDLKLRPDGKYRRREVEKNLRQLTGAYRQLFRGKTPIALVNPRRGEEQFDPSQIRETYLISVLLGGGEDVFSPMETIDGHPVHVFTSDFTRIVLTELDTISDFIGYIQAKQKLLFTDKQFIIVGGEEELLALYLQQGRSFQALSQATNVIIEGGLWERLQQDPGFREKKAEDQLSYLWDSIIDSVHRVREPKYETIARELARPNRFHRRFLAKAYFEMQSEADQDMSQSIARRCLLHQGVTYCFIFAGDDLPREHRRRMLEEMCWIARGTFVENPKVIGIASEKQVRVTRSWDFCLLELPELSDENRSIIEDMRQRTGILLKPHIHVVHEDEYPK